jgi:AraC-like DNA-binding protein
MTNLLRVPDWPNLAYEAKFKPGVMAAMCSVSLRQLERFFLKQFHQTPRVWAKELQMRMARQKITEGWKNKAVVDELGFGNASQLCHDFQKYFGGAPRSFGPSFISGTLKAEPSCRY